MPYDPHVHHRRSIRLAGFDYARRGAYFVTFCVHQRRCLLGSCSEGRMQLSAAGAMIEEELRSLSSRHSEVELDQFIVMPNHVHVVLWIAEKEHQPGINLRHAGDRPHGTDRGTLGRIIQAVKTSSTNRYIRGVREHRWPAFDRHVWQPNYFEHIIRDDESLGRIREYIATNPQRWSNDMENPDGDGTDDVEIWLNELCGGEPRVRPTLRSETKARANTRFAPTEKTGENTVRAYKNAASGRGEPSVRRTPVAETDASRGPAERPEGEHEVRPYEDAEGPRVGRARGSPLRIGHGYDLHRLQPGGKLMLGGVQVASDLSPVAHSDGDVVIHALVDALLGALGLGDIGEHFPNTDPQWKDAASRVFLERVYEQVKAAGYRLVNADVTILAERPKLKNFKSQISDFLRDLLDGPVNIKAGTNEGCDAIGRGEAIAAHAVVLLVAAK